MQKTCVIVLNYFSSENTESCVYSLIGQPFNTLYLVDNSADEQQEIFITGLAKKLKNQGADFKVEHIISNENVGFGKGINCAIKEDFLKTGGHDLYLLLNNDTVLPNNTISVLLEEKQQRPNVFLLSPKINWGGVDVCYHGYIEQLGHVTHYSTKFSKPYISGCCVLVDSKLIDETHNLFDEAFFMYGEDVLLNWKAKRMGGEIFCTNRVTIFHKGSGSSSHGELFYEYHVARGHVLLALKLKDSIVGIISFVLGRVVYLFLRGVLRSVRYRSFIPMKAYLMSWFPLKIRIN